ncbi:MAG: hypothetical protein EAY81_05860 [Bacteroidetes bacterium]|nr:MAG: hypothetical protein EAY81_05860 [Bacteroidota bacterium]
MKKPVLLVTLSCLTLISISNQAKAQNGSLPAHVNPREVYCLSMLSNIPAQTVGTPVRPFMEKTDVKNSISNIVNYATPIINQCLSNAVDSTSSSTKLSLNNWKLFWGPGVIPMPSNIIDIKLKGDYYVSTVSMSIFQNTSTNTMVVAIQATNPYSYYAWNTLDFGVNSTVPWDDTASHGVVSNGTSLGLNYLINLTNQSNYNGISALLSACNSTTNVVVTGHSLGGALSPVLALYLKNKYPAIANNVYCLSTAGATPGDNLFAQYYNSQLGNNTVRIWNNFDVIPHAWNTTILQSMQSQKSQDSKLYTGGIYSMQGGSVFYDPSYLKCNKNKAQPSAFTPMSTPLYINSLINWAISRTGNTNYTPICNGGQSFMGAAANTNGTNYYIDVAPMDKLGIDFLSSILKLITNNSYQITDGYFLPEMGAQHVDAYTYQFQMMQIHEYLRTQIENNPNSIVNMCSLFSSFQDGFYKLGTTEATKKTDPYSTFRALVYKHAWKL